MLNPGRRRSTANRLLVGVLAVLTVLVLFSGCVISGTAGVSHHVRTPAGITSAGAAMEFSR